MTATRIIELQRRSPESRAEYWESKYWEAVGVIAPDVPTQPEPTPAELQQQLATVRERLRAVESIAFRPINITVNFPGWPHPIVWLRKWWAERDERRISRLAKRHRARAIRRWNKLCVKAQRDHRWVTSIELDRAWAAAWGADGWLPPPPLRVRLREWWRGRELRRGIRRMGRLAAKASRADVLLANDASLREQDKRIKEAVVWHDGRRSYDPAAGLRSGRKAILWAREKIQERKKK